MAYPNKEIRHPATGQLIRFLQTSRETQGELLEMESVFSPRSLAPPLHFHPNQDEQFEVLEGCLTVNCKGRQFQLQAGEGLFIPAQTPHAMWNMGETAARVNWKVFPAMKTEYLLETLMGLAADGKTNSSGKPTFLQTVLTARQFAAEFRLASPAPLVQSLLFSLLSPIARLKGLKGIYPKYLD